MFTLLLWLSIHLGSAQATEIAIPAAECACHKDHPDRFEEPLRFDFGTYAGRCVNSCKFRRAIFLDEDEAKLYGADSNHVVVANLLHEGKYWIARVPVRSSNEVDVAFERFFLNISHVILRFRFPFEDPVELFAISGDSRKPERKIYDLVLSAEAVPPIDRPFEIFESSLGRYLLAYRILSIEDTYRWMVEDKRHTVKQFRLNIDDEKRSRILRAALAESQTKSFKSAYRLLTNNCSTSLFGFIDREIGYSPMVLDWLGLVPVQSAIPMDSTFGTIYALGARRLMSERNQLYNLEVELSLLKARLIEL